MRDKGFRFRNSLLITHYSLLITHYSLLITHYSLLITPYPQTPRPTTLKSRTEFVYLED